MEKHLEQMKRYLIAGMAGAGIDRRDLSFSKGAQTFQIADAGVAVALGRTREGAAWKASESFEVADLREGGFRRVAETICTGRAGEEAAIAKKVLMRIIERRIDTAFDGG